MMFILGIICGILIALVVFLGHIYLALKGKNPIKKSILYIEEKGKPKAQIFMPPTPEQVAQQEIIDRNSTRGQNTTAEELGI